MSTCIISSFCPGCKHIFPIRGKSKKDADKICLQCNPGAIPRYITEGYEGRGFYRWAICTVCYGKMTYSNGLDVTTDLTQTIYRDSVKDKHNYWSHCDYSAADLPQSISYSCPVRGTLLAGGEGYDRSKLRSSSLTCLEGMRAVIFYNIRRKRAIDGRYAISTMSPR